MLRVFCTNCKPEFEVKPSEHSLSDRCLCGNVSCNWLIGFGKEEKEHFSTRQPFRVNSFDSRRYRIERDGVNITGQGTPVKAPWDEPEENEDEE